MISLKIPASGHKNALLAATQPFVAVPVLARSQCQLAREPDLPVFLIVTYTDIIARQFYR